MSLISKKELLKLTGISYGQLYRWKREGLIPDGWFNKQSAFTGQETFFPREKILARIEAIQKLKDKYSLEELAKVLSPDVAERRFTADDLAKISEVAPGVITVITQNAPNASFSFTETLVFIALSDAVRAETLNYAEIGRLVAGGLPKCADVGGVELMFIVYKAGRELFACVADEKAKVFFSTSVVTVYKANLGDTAANIKMKYRKSFGFDFGKDDGDET